MKTKNQIVTHDRTSSPIDIVHSLHETGVCVISSFVMPHIMDQVRTEFNSLFERHKNDIDDQNYQETIYLRPESVDITSNYGNVLINGRNNSIQSCKAINSLFQSDVLQEVASLFYNTEEFIYAVRWQLSKSHGTPDVQIQAPYTLHFDRQHFFKYFLYLTDVGANDGPLTFLTGEKHRDNAVSTREQYKNSLKIWNDINNNYEISNLDSVIPMHLKSGDLIIFDSNVPHFQGRITDGRYRESIIMESQSREEYFFSDRTVSAIKK